MGLKQSILKEIKDDDYVIDLCAGTGHWLAGHPCNKFGIELNPKYREDLRKNGYDFVICDVRDLMPIKSDVVIWIDGIEHLESDEAEEVLMWYERNTKKMIVFTPNEFQDNKHNAAALGEPLQEHKSVFPTQYWINRGYRVVYQEYNQGDKVNNLLYVKEVENE